MHTPAGHLNALPYISQEETKAFKLPDPSSADILPLNFTTYLCQQGEHGPTALWNYKLQQQLSSELMLSAKMNREAEAAETNGQSTFRPIFGSNCSTIEVFFQIESNGERAPPTSRKATLEDIKALGCTLDKNYEKIFVMFGVRLQLIYGEKIEEYMEKALRWNIKEYASGNPPAIPMDTRHKNCVEWLLSSLHLCWPPWAQGSIYYWGIWMEQAQAKLGSVTTKDTNVKGHMKKALLPLCKAMGAITRAQRILLAAIDLECLQEYEKILSKCLDHRTSFETDERECFTLRTCSVNVFTEPHVDGGDVKNDWASICPLGEFENGDFCIIQLKRRFVYKKNRKLRIYSITAFRINIMNSLSIGMDIREQTTPGNLSRTLNTPLSLFRSTGTPTTQITPSVRSPPTILEWLGTLWRYPQYPPIPVQSPRIAENTMRMRNITPAALKSTTSLSRMTTAYFGIETIGRMMRKADRDCEISE
ncbi:hypothetical protein B9Z19DRAFT_1120408 [Tuber borchii]|uniref:Uncharacterized protein n=1 Tax=Tuber borchii TaxID=42251 RepID=A0A2T7A4H3_TUBBO|nr:hypothetical protein B9Z19DRAFT_1120408 [Tuber borchii]